MNKLIHLYNKDSVENDFALLIKVDNNDYLLYNENVLLLTNNNHNIKMDKLLTFNKVIVSISDIYNNINVDNSYKYFIYDVDDYFTTKNVTINVDKIMKDFNFTKKERFKVKRIYYANDYKRKNEYRRKLKNREFKPY